MANNQPLQSPKIIFDIGSSTVKIHQREENGKLTHFKNQSIPFKNNFDSKKGIDPQNKEALFALINHIKSEHPDRPIKLYATAIFRKLEPTAKRILIHEVFERTNLYFNIIEQDLENFYLEMAWSGKFQKDEPILLINIGGGSTELIIKRGQETLERKNLDLGIGVINNQFPQINNALSEIPLDEVVEYIKNLLPDLPTKIQIALYSGGELTYMKLVQYPLLSNTLFEDNDHPFFIHLKDFQRKNQDIFHQTTLEQLEELMPENPTWMHGARACSALAQAIGQKYALNFLIPSDSNLAHGVARQELRTVTLSGSFRKHLSHILEIKKSLEQQNIKVLSPRFVEPKNPDEEFVVFAGEEGSTPLALERHHLESIEKSDALIVCDPLGYVGASALIEIGFAQSLGKRIIFIEKPEEFMLNTLPAEIGL